MSKVDKLIIDANLKAQEKMEELTEKKPGDSQLVVALVLIAVAIGLCIIFRNQIFTIMKDLFNTIGNQINNLTNGAVNA